MTGVQDNQVLVRRWMAGKPIHAMGNPGVCKTLVYFDVSNDPFG